MKLYHGTSEKAAQAILASGRIEPRGKRRGNFAMTVMSSRRHVYLTDSYALYFAIMACRDDDNARLAVLEIDTDRLDIDRLNADEDALEQTQRGTDSLPLHWTVHRRTRHYRDTLANTVYSWQASLAAMGTCCHDGPIDVSAVSRIAYVDPASQPGLTLASYDAQVSVMNYRFVSKQHRAMTAWVMGTDHLPDDLKPWKINEFTEFRWPPAPSRQGIEVVTISSNGTIR